LFSGVVTKYKLQVAKLIIYRHTLSGRSATFHILFSRVKEDLLLPENKHMNYKKNGGSPVRCIPNISLMIEKFVISLAYIMDSIYSQKDVEDLSKFGFIST
jgi:hypothetical protein